MSFDLLLWPPSVIMLNVAAPWAVIQKGFMSLIPWSDDDAADEGADAAGQVDDATSGKVVEPASVQPSCGQGYKTFYGRKLRTFIMR